RLKTDSAAPLPRHVRWFAPWMWMPWKRWLLIGLQLLLVGYLFSPAPLLYLQHRFRTHEYPVVDNAINVALLPFRMAAEKWRWVAPFYSQQYQWIESTFGPT
ncbi:MAG: hypothetical protein B7Z55_06120, partial [Planctomycetales bacterium 12-60-4]